MNPRFHLPLCLLLSACAVTPIKINSAPEPLPEITKVFDCLRENRLALVAAHRGRQTPQSPENSLAAFAQTREQGPVFIEADISRSKDGVLMLMHDATLDRTTTGIGPFASKTYPELRELFLQDGEGKVTKERIPTLEEALIWSRRNRTALQLDLKDNVPLAEVLKLVRHERMQGQVILIANSYAQSLAYMRAAPEIMVATTARTQAEVNALMARANSRMLFFTGTREPGPALVAQLDAAKVEAVTGTIGGLDEAYLADGKTSEYPALAERGVTLISSDRAGVAWKALKSGDRDGTICLAHVRK